MLFKHLHHSIYSLALIISSKSIGFKPISSPANNACFTLKAIFPHLVSFPGSIQFENDTEHWAASSEQLATCSIEPTSSDDISEILKIVGHPDIRSPFAVKSGGHSFTPNFSSTPGVQISMSKFTDIVVDKEHGLVTVGVGLTWDQVYEQLDPLNLTVAGGRIFGVGVGGLSLGGGYSWKTDQFGLTIDNIVAHNLVLPNGEQVRVTDETNPDLFFALKGSLNNFGIVTDIVFKALPQEQMFGGVILYSVDVLDQVNEALSNFSLQNNDTRAQAIVAYRITNGDFVASAFLSFSSPDDTGIFDPFLSIPSMSSDVKQRTISDFLTSIGPLNPEFSPFGYAGHDIPVTRYTKPLIDEMAQLVISTESDLRNRFPQMNFTARIALEPFINANAHSLGGAYPHPSSRPVTPASAEITYSISPNLSTAEQTALYTEFAAIVKNLTNTIQAQAISEGVSRMDDILYPNYALPDTPLELMYGDNVPRLRELAAKFDPGKVMSLTGGFRFQS